MQIGLFTEDKTAFISGLSAGEPFYRTKALHMACYLYMRVDPCGDIDVSMKEVGRNCLIVNLKTGALFSVDGNEQVIPANAVIKLTGRA